MTFIEKICLRFNELNIPYAVVGGYAVALHGAPRGTIDLDLIISLKESCIVSTQKALESMGLKSLLPINGHDLYKFRVEYINNRNLIAWSFYNPLNPMELVDIVITVDLDDCSIKKVKISHGEINILSKLDLIKMKKLSGRPQDLLDIEALKKL